MLFSVSSLLECSPNPVLKLNIPAHRGSVTRLGVSSQTGMILSGSPDGTVCLWDSIGNHVKSFFPPLLLPVKCFTPVLSLRMA